MLKDRNFNRVISDISIVLRETTLTISDFIETGSPVESKIVRVVRWVSATLSQVPIQSIGTWDSVAHTHRVSPSTTVITEVRDLKI